MSVVGARHVLVQLSQEVNELHFVNKSAYNLGRPHLSTLQKAFMSDSDLHEAWHS